MEFQDDQSSFGMLSYSLSRPHRSSATRSKACFEAKGGVFRPCAARIMSVRMNFSYPGLCVEPGMPSSLSAVPPAAILAGAWACQGVLAPAPRGLLAVARARAANGRCSRRPLGCAQLPSCAPLAALGG